MIVKMSIPERVALSRKHNPNWADKKLCLSNTELHGIILNLYGLRQVGEVLDLTFAIEDDKKYLMYVLTR